MINKIIHDISEKTYNAESSKQTQVYINFVDQN